jgi:hypothetical protein
MLRLISFALSQWLRSAKMGEVRGKDNIPNIAKKDAACRLARQRDQANTDRPNVLRHGRSCPIHLSKMLLALIPVPITELEDRRRSYQTPPARSTPAASICLSGASPRQSRNHQRWKGNMHAPRMLLWHAAIRDYRLKPTALNAKIELTGRAEMAVESDQFPVAETTAGCKKSSCFPGSCRRRCTLISQTIGLHCRLLTTLIYSDHRAHCLKLSE